MLETPTTTLIVLFGSPPIAAALWFPMPGLLLDGLFGNFPTTERRFFYFIFNFIFNFIFYFIFYFLFLFLFYFSFYFLFYFLFYLFLTFRLRFPEEPLALSLELVAMLILISLKIVVLTPTSNIFAMRIKLKFFLMNPWV